MLELAAKGGARRPRPHKQPRADNAAHRHSFDGEARATALQPRASNQHPPTPQPAPTNPSPTCS